MGLYLLLGLILPDTITFLGTVTLMGVDFYVVRQVVGLPLVGLQWWMIIQEEGVEEWIRENGSREKNCVDRVVFWGGLGVTCGLWLLLTILNLLTFSPIKV